MRIPLGKGVPVATPKHFLNNEKYPPIGLMILTEYMADAVKNLTNITSRLQPRVKPYIITYRNKNLTLLYPFFGAPATIFTLEIAIAGGLRHLLALGEAGAIHPSVKIGDYIIPKWGVREEGTSYHYRPPEYSPIIDNNLQTLISQTLRKLGGRVHEGGVWSIDAIFRETRDKIKAYSAKGILCVDMEATALMTVADYRGIELAMVLVASDELYHSKWIRGWGTEKLKKAEYRSVEAALNTITKYTPKQTP